MTKKARQQKSRTYYYFWGLATLAVVTGQLYVGTGYRIMAEGVNNLTNGLYQALE
jgi:hypothetical protein